MPRVVISAVEKLKALGSVMAAFNGRFVSDQASMAIIPIHK